MQSEVISVLEGEPVFLSLELAEPEEGPPRWSRADGAGALGTRWTSASEGPRATLRAESATLDDAGEYVLAGAAGAPRRRVRLEVRPRVDAAVGAGASGEPLFLRRLTDLAVKVGARTRLIVEIQSDTELQVTWYRNARRLQASAAVVVSDEGRFHWLELAAASPEDSGRWTCAAHNQTGRAECSAHLNVIVPKAYKRPEFLEELRAILTDQGTVSLECKVVGVPTPALRWFKDSEEIRAGDVFALTANPEDATSLGTYTCEAANCMGKAYSSSKVHVVGRGSREGSFKPADSAISSEPPPVFIVELQDRHIKIGDPLELACRVGVPPWPRGVAWYGKAGRADPARSSALEDGAGGLKLVVPSTAWDDEGEWKCVATGAGGRLAVSTCKVTIDVPKNYRKPRFMEELKAVLTEEGLVSFECKVVGFPTPQLSWFKDGLELRPGDVYQLTGSNSLGSYCCIASNCMGQASSKAELTVEDIQNQLDDEERMQLFSENKAPKFVQPLKSQEAKINEDFKFTVKVSISPEPTLAWYRDDQPVDESPRYRTTKESKGICHLDIHQLEITDQAEWKCIATNEFGHSVTSCFLKLVIPRHFKKPRFLESLRAILSEEGAVNLECKVIGVPQPVLKWYKDGEELKPGDIHRIISGQDGTCCLGTYTCEAQNCMGIAASSASLLGFETADAVKASKPEPELHRNISLSTIHEERTSQLYDTPAGDITLDEKGEISFSFDGKEVSVSLYETPDLTEEEALQIVEMYADQLSENITEQNVVELPPLRFVKETSTSGNLLMEAIVIDVSPDYFASAEDDLRTEADLDEMSIIEDMGGSTFPVEVTEPLVLQCYEARTDIPARPPRKKSESIKSGEDYFSLSKERSLSEKSKDQEQQPTSDSPQTFATAKSSELNKLKPQKATEGENISVSSLPPADKEGIEKADKPRRTKKARKDRSGSQGSRKSSTGSEKSLDTDFKSLPSKKDTEEITQKIITLIKICKVVQSHLQAVEEEVIMQSALMSSAATAKKSLEVISSVTTPIEAIQNTCGLLKNAGVDSKSTPHAFQKFVPALKSLQQNLAIIEKCVEIEGGGHTLVQRTSICLIETLAKPMQSILSLIKNVTVTLDNVWPSKNTQEINILLSDIATALAVSEDSIKSVQLIKQAEEMTASTARLDTLTSGEPTDKSAIMQNIWKPVLKLQKSLEAIKENTCSDKDIQIQDYVMDLISKPIQELQLALESIEEAAVRESNENLFDINSAILQSIVQPMLRLRNDLNSLSEEEHPSITEEVIENLISSINFIKNNLIDIGELFDIKDLEPFEENQKTIQHIARNLLTLQSNIELFVEGNKDFSFTKDFDDLQTQLATILEHAVQLSTFKSLEVLGNLVTPTDMVNESFNYIRQDDMENFLTSIMQSVDLLQQKVTYVQSQDLEELRDCLTTSLSSIEKLKLKVNESIVTKHVLKPDQQQIVLKESSECLSNIVNNIEKNILHATRTEESEHLDSLKELSQKEKIHSLQRLASILVELRDTIAAAEIKSSESPEQIISLADFFVARELAAPLNELNRSLNVLAQQTYEEYDTLHESKEFSALNTLANPFYDFHNNLTVIQHQAQSQISDRLESFVPDSAIAKTLRDLNTCLVEVQQQFALEVGDDMSTMQDISGIKSTAEAKHIVVESIPTTKIDVALETAPDFMEKDLNIGSSIPLEILQQSLKNMQECLDINSFDELEEYSFSPLRSLAECVLNLKECIELSHLEQSQIEDIPPANVAIKKHLETLENSLDTIRNQKYEQSTEANIDNETFRKLNLITDSVLQLEKNVKIIKGELLKDDGNITKPLSGEHIEDIFMSSKRDNLAINEEPLFYDNVGDVTSATDISLLKTLANPLEDLRLAVGAIQQQRIWEACDVMEIADASPPANLAVSLQDLLNGIAVVQKELTVESAESLKYQDRSDYLQAIAKPMQELNKYIIAVQENLVNEPHDDESILGDFTYTTTLAECLETVQRCFAVLEQHEMVDLTQASDLQIQSEIELQQYAEEFIEKEIDQQRNVIENTMAIFVDIEKTSEMIKEPNEISVEKIETIKNYMKKLQEIFSEPLNQVLDRKNELARILLMTENSIDDFELQELTKTVKNESIKTSLKSSMASVKNNLTHMKEMIVKINNYTKNRDFVRPIKDIQHFTKQIETLPEPISQNFAFLESIIVPLREICHKFELADLTADAVQSSDVQVNSVEIVEPLRAVFKSISTCKDIMFDLNSEELNAATESLANALEVIINDIDVKNNPVISCGVLKSISNPLRTINCVVSGRLKDFETSELSSLEISNLAEPIKILQVCLSSVQKQLMQPSDEDTLTADISLVESYAEPIIELQKDLCEIEEILLDNKDATLEEKMSVISSVESSIHNLQDSLSEIEEKSLTQKGVSCFKELQDSLNVVEQKISHLDDKDILIQHEKAFLKSDKDIIDKLELKTEFESEKGIQYSVSVLPEKLLEPLTELQLSLNVIQQQMKWETCESIEDKNIQNELNSLANKVTCFKEAVQEQQILSVEKLNEITESVEDLKVFAARAKDLSQSSTMNALFNSVTQSLMVVQNHLVELKLESQIGVFEQVTDLTPPTEFISVIPKDFDKDNLKILLEPLEILKIAVCEVQKQRVQEACDVMGEESISAVTNDNYAICVQDLEKRIAIVQEELLSECTQQIDDTDFIRLKNTLNELCECIVTVQENVNYELCCSKQTVHNALKVLENVKDCYNKLDKITTGTLEILSKEDEVQIKKEIQDDLLQGVEKDSGITSKEKIRDVKVECFSVPLESLQVAVDAMREELGLVEIVDDESKVALKTSSQKLLDSIATFQKGDLPKREQIENVEILYNLLTSVEENFAQVSKIEKCPLQVQNTLEKALTDVKISILNVSKESEERIDTLLSSALDQDESFLINNISKPLENIKQAVCSIQFDIKDTHDENISVSLQDVISSIQNKLSCDSTYLQDIESPLQELCSLVDHLKEDLSLESQHKPEIKQTLKYIVTIENCIDEAQNVILFLKKNIPDEDVKTLELKQVVNLCKKHISEHRESVSEEMYKTESASPISDSDILLLKTLSQPLNDLKVSIGALQQEKSWETCESIEEYMSPTKMNVKITQSLQNVLDEIAIVQKELPFDSTNILTDVQKTNCLQAVAKPLQELCKSIAVAQENLVNEPFDEQISLKDFTNTTTLAESLKTVQEHLATLDQHELIHLAQVLEFQTSDVSCETKDDIATVLIDKEIENQRQSLQDTVDVFENIQQATDKIAGSKLSIEKLEEIKLYVLKAQQIFTEPLAYVFSHKTDLAKLLEKTQIAITDFEINELTKEITNKPIYDSLKQSLTLINESSMRMMESLKKINYYCRQKNIVKPINNIKHFVKYVEATPLPEGFTEIELIKNPLREICEKFEYVDLHTDLPQNNDELSVQSSDVCEQFMAIQKVLSAFNKKYSNTADMQEFLKYSNNLKQSIENVLKETNIVTNTLISSNILRSISAPVNEINKFMKNKHQKEKSKQIVEKELSVITTEQLSEPVKKLKECLAIVQSQLSEPADENITSLDASLAESYAEPILELQRKLMTIEENDLTDIRCIENYIHELKETIDTIDSNRSDKASCLLILKNPLAEVEEKISAVIQTAEEKESLNARLSSEVKPTVDVLNQVSEEKLLKINTGLIEQIHPDTETGIAFDDNLQIKDYDVASAKVTEDIEKVGDLTYSVSLEKAFEEQDSMALQRKDKQKEIKEEDDEIIQTPISHKELIVSKELLQGDDELKQNGKEIFEQDKEEIQTFEDHKKKEIVVEKELTKEEVDNKERLEQEKRISEKQGILKDENLKEKEALNRMDKDDQKRLDKDQMEEEKSEAIETKKRKTQEELEQKEKYEKLENEKDEAAQIDKLQQKELTQKEKLRLEKEKEDSERIETENLEADEIAKQKLEDELQLREKDEKEHLEKDELDKQKVDEKKQKEEVRVQKEKREESDRIEKEKQEAAKIEKQKVEDELKQKEKDENERLEKEKLEKQKLEAADLENQKKKEIARLEQEKQESDKLEKQKLEVAKIEKQRAEDELKQKEKDEKERLEKDEMDAAKKEKHRLEEELKQKEKDENERLEKEKQRLEAAELENQKQEELKQKEKERLEKEKLESDKLEKKKQEAAKIEQQKAEDEIKRKEKDEKERLEKEKLEKQKIEAAELENQKQKEKCRLEKEKEESDRIEREKQEAAEIEKQKVDDEIKQKEKDEKERLEKGKLEKQTIEAAELENQKQKEKERLEKEKQESDRLEKEKQEAAKIEKQKAEDELKEKEKAEMEHLEKDKLDKQKEEELKQKEKVRMDKEKEESDRLEKDKQEATKIEKQKEEDEIKRKGKDENERSEKENLDKQKAAEHENQKQEEIKQKEKLRLEKEKEESDRLEKEEQETAKLEEQKAEDELKQKETQERERLEQEKLDTAKKEKEREEEELRQKEKDVNERLEKEIIEKQKLEADKLEKQKQEEKERLEIEEKESNRLEKEKQEAAKIEKQNSEDKLTQKENDEKERLEKETLNAAEKEKQRLEDELKQKEMDENERLEEEKLEKQKLKDAELEKEKQEELKQKEKERLEKEKEENDRLETEKQEAARIEKQKAEDELKEKEKDERERSERDKLDAAKKEQHRLEEELKQKEKDEKERLEKEKRKLEAAELENQKQEELKQKEKECLEKEKQESDRLEKEKQEAAKIEQQKAEDEIKRKEKDEKERLEKEKLEKQKIEAAELENQKQKEKLRLEKEIEENDRIEREKQEAAKIEKQKVEDEIKQKETDEKERLEKEKLEKQKLETAELENQKQKEKERLEIEKQESDRLEKEKQEAAKIEQQKAEDEIKRKEKDERERLEKEKLEKQKIEAAELENQKQEGLKRKEKERLEKEKQENVRLEKEKQEAAKIEKQKAEEELKQKEKDEKERLEKEKLEINKIEAAELENLKQEELKRKEKERLEKEKQKSDRLEKEKQEAAKIEKQKAEDELKQKEKDEKERLEKEKLEKQKIEAAELENQKQEELKQKEKLRLEKEKQESDRLEREKQEVAKIEKQKAEDELKQKEKDEKERLEKEKLEKQKIEAAELENQKQEELKQKEKLRLEKEKQESDRLEREKQEVAKIEKQKAEDELKQKEKDEKERLEKEKLEKQKIEAAELENQKQEELKQKEKLRLEKEKQESDRLEREKQEVAKIEKQKAEDELKQKEKDEKERLEKEKLEKQKIEAAELENQKHEELKQKEKLRLEKEKEESDRLKREKKEAAKIEKQKAEDELKQKEKDEKERLEKETLDAAKKEKQRLEDELKQKEKDENERLEKEKLEKQKLKAAELEKEKQEELKQKEKVRLEKEREESDRLEKEKQKAAEIEKQKAEDELKQKEKDEYERLKKDELEKQKLETDKLEKQKQDEKERLEKQKKVNDRLEKEKQEAAKIEKQKAEDELKQKEKDEKERLEKEKEDRLEKEKQDAANIEKQKAEYERKQKEKDEKDRLEKEKLDAAKKEKEKYENERLEKEKMEKQKLETAELEKQKQEELIQKEKMRLEKEKEESNRLDKEKEEAAKLEKQRVEDELKQKDKDEKERLEKEAEDKLKEKRKMKEEKKAAKLKAAEIKKQQEEEELKQKENNEQERLLKEALDKEKLSKIEQEKVKEHDKLEQVKDIESLKNIEIATQKMKDSKKREQTEKERMVEEESNKMKETKRLQEEKKAEKLKVPDDKKTEQEYDGKMDKVDEKDKKNSLLKKKTHILEEKQLKKHYASEDQSQKEDDKTRIPKDMDLSNDVYAESVSKKSETDTKISFLESKRFTDDETDKTEISVRDRHRTDKSYSESSRTMKSTSILSNSSTNYYTSSSRQKSIPGPRDTKKKPIFSTHLTDRTAVEGSRVKLTCSVLGSPEPKVEWYRNGILLSDQNKYKTKYTDGLTTLEVLNAVPSDSADYTCTATNENGTISCSASLKVYAGFETTPIPPTFTRSIKDTYHIAEDELVLECRIRGQPVPTISWVKDGKSLTSNGRYHMHYLADGLCRLVINRPDPSDTGRYTCKAENPLWSDEISHQVQFSGRDMHLASSPLRFESVRSARSAHEARRPYFSRVLTDHSVPVGGTIALQVEVGGGAAEVEWRRGGAPLPPGRARAFAERNVHTLAVENASAEESGVYSCTVRNAHGVVATVATVSVLSPGAIRSGKPACILARPDQDLSVCEGEDFTVSLRAQGEPKPKVIWMKGVRELTGSWRSLKEVSDDYCRFTLKRAQMADAGTYCILAKNCYGCDRAFVTVFVRQRLDSESSTSSSGQLIDSYSDVSFMRDVPQAIVGEPEVSEVGADWVSLRWVRPPRGAAAPVLAYRVEGWLQGAEGGARWAPLGLSPVNGFDAFRLAPGAYLFRVTPRNRYGWGPSAQTSIAVQIGGKPSLPEFTTPLPGQVKALVGTSLTLVCVVAGCPTVCWLKDGEELDGDGPGAGGRCSLTVRRVAAHHQGRYCCRATTAAGSATTFARVAVVTDRKIWEADDNFKKYLESDTEDRAPVFSMRLRDRRVQVTYPVRLTCRVEGRPTPVLQWTKDGELLEQDDLHTFSSSDRFHTLEISCAQLEHGGQYAAHAANPLGAVRCAAALTVDKGLRAYLAPEFALAPEPLYRVPEGAELRVRACVEAYPSVGVAWHRDGVRLRPSRRALFTLDREGEIEMTLAGVTRRDAGVYTVTASNMVGRATCSTRVEVLPPEWGSTDQLDRPPIFITASLPYSKEPMFTKKPRSSEAKEGDTVVILCEVIGDPKPEVLWLRDWLKPEYYRDATTFRRVGAGPEYRLEIPHAKLDHTGAYSVIATNCHGEAKAVISLQITAKGPDEMDHGTIKTGRVFVLPRICRELRDLRCCDGDAVTFECQVEGTPAPTLHWEKDGLPVPDGGDFKMETDSETARLTISCVYPEDEGVYTCIAFNELGKAYTSSCLIVDVPEEKENLVSQQLARPAMLLSAGSTPRSTPRSSPRNTPARSVSPHRPSTRQRESMSRSPSRGSRWKMCPPKFYAVPFNRVAEEGETVSFRCSIAGHPTPTVTWDKDGSDLPGSTRITIRENDDDRILQISDVKYEDSGMYRVTLDNEVGRVEATACLDVINLRGGSSHSLRSSEGSRTSPSVRRHLNGPQSRVGDRLRLSSEIRGSPAPRSKWYRNGEQLAFSERIFEIKEGDTFNLIINSAKTSDSGDYTLVASNEYGEVSSWSKVNVVNTILHGNIDCIGEHQPHIIKELKDIEVTDGKAVEIQLEVENCCIFTFMWMKDDKVLPDSDIFKYVDYGNGVIGLRFEDIYVQDSDVYTCVIKNKFGFCKSSCRISVTDSTVGIALNGFSVYPEPVVVQEGEDACFSVTIDTNPVLLNAKVVWQIAGREVVKDSSKFKLTSQDLNHSIKLLNVRGNDSGTVRCAVRIKNQHGQSYESLWYTTQLTVVPKAYLDPALEDATTNRKMQPKKLCAKFVNKLESVTVPKRGKICLQASFQGYPEPTVRWFKSDREIELSERVKIITLPGESSLIIREADFSDAAMYKIIIDNSHGKGILTSKVAVEDTDINKEPPPLYKIDDGNLFDSKYKIYNVIGRGHFGSVKLIVDKSTGEKLAAKFVKIMKPKDKEITISELEIMHCLKHPKLIQLVDAFIKMNQMIIITEYVSGGQLFERVSEEDFTLTERDCILFMTQILEGVGFMHSKNIVHLDLKPENIMCHTRPSHEIKIIDFGLARRLNPHEEIRTLCGTAEFIAPEVVNFDPISTASDMWSVGVICYILLSGLSPFAGDTVQDTYSNILRVKYDFEDEAFDNISEDAKEFIQDLLVKPMDNRPSATQCLQTKWMKQHKEKRSSTALSTEKLRKFVIQSKWQMTGNAIRAVGRMASLCAISRMNTSRLPGKSAAAPGPINTPKIVEEISYQNAETDRDQHSKQK